MHDATVGEIDMVSALLMGEATTCELCWEKSCVAIDFDCCLVS